MWESIIYCIIYIYILYWSKPFHSRTPNSTRLFYCQWTAAAKQSSISLQHLQCDLWCFHVDGRKMHPGHVSQISQSCWIFPGEWGQQPGECNLRGVLKGMDLNIFFKMDRQSAGFAGQMSKCPTAHGWWPTIWFWSQQLRADPWAWNIWTRSLCQEDLSSIRRKTVHLTETPTVSGSIRNWL